MTDETRRTIVELIARYDLVPDLQYVYVEGKYDKELLESAFSGGSRHKRAVYAIDSINVPSDVLTKHGLTSGNKQRVIALAEELSAINHESCAYRCVVDKDTDHWLDAMRSVKRLIWTQFNEMMLSLADKDTIEHILVGLCRVQVNSFDVLFDSMSRILSCLYAMRLADKILETSLKWIQFYKLLSRDGDAIVFEYKEYVERLLNKNAKSAIKSEFTSEVTNFMKKFEGDYRNSARDHDLVDVMVWVVVNYGGLGDMASATVLERIFLARAMHNHEAITGVLI
jgi:hypothetical protein